MASQKSLPGKLTGEAGSRTPGCGGGYGGARPEDKDSGGRGATAGIRAERLPMELKSIVIKDKLRPGTARG